MSDKCNIMKSSKKNHCVLILWILIVVEPDCTETQTQEFAQCGRVDDFRRIVSTNDIGLWPWMGSIGFYSAKQEKWNHQCGATLISTRFVLTAAHCAEQKDWQIRFGDQNLEDISDDWKTTTRSIKRIHIHPKYQKEQVYFDIAILEVDEVELSHSIRLICLPQKSSLDVALYNSHSVTLTGWGAEHRSGVASATLHRAQLTIYDYEYCNETHAETGGLIKQKVNTYIPDLFQLHILCAGYEVKGTGSCQGDSGGPLVHFNTKYKHFVQLGSVAGGIGECGDESFPGIYIRLDHPHVLGFIKNVTNLPLTIEGDGCTTNEGKECIFPFIFNGVTYNQCSAQGSDSPWCATKLSRDQEIEDWGTCQSICHKLHPKDKRKKKKKICVDADGEKFFTDDSSGCPEIPTTPRTTKRPVFIRPTTTRPPATRRPTVARRTTAVPVTKRSTAAPVIETKPPAACLYTCKETGSCTVRTVAEGSSRDGALQGFCFSVEFGGKCSGIPQNCRSCLGPCKSRTGDTFQLKALSNSKDVRPSGSIVSQQKSESNLDEIEVPITLDRCLHTCQANGGCSVEIIAGKSFSGSVKGSCFPPSFGGQCSGIPELCQDCIEVCAAQPGKTKISVPAGPKFEDNPDQDFDYSQGRSLFDSLRFGRSVRSPSTMTSLASKITSLSLGNRCVKKCRKDGFCNVQFLSDRFR